MSIAGGMEQAVARAVSLGCTALQVFTKSSNQWRARPLPPDEVERFRSAIAGSAIGAVVAHDSYLINLAAPGDDLWSRSVAALIEEIERCALLGIGTLVLHPGAHVGSGLEAGIARITEALNRAHEATAGQPVITALETHAGQGTTIGDRFEHLRDILAGLRRPERAAVCFDTCHAFAAGYPIHTDEGWDTTLAEFDRVVGLERIACVHVNDSVKGLGCRVDRHAGIGEGAMGLTPFIRLVTDPRTRALPLVLETPKGEDLAEDVRNLGLLRRLAAEGRRAAAGSVA